MSDKILIGASRGIKSSMSIISHLYYIVYGNIFSDESIERVNQLSEIRYFFIIIEVRIHLTSVDTRISATCTYDADTLTQHRRQRLLDSGLHTHSIRLNLPTMKRSSIIG